VGDAPALYKIVCAALPGDDKQKSARRLAVLQVVNAASAAELKLEFLGAAISAYLQSPDDTDASAYAWRAWVESERLATQLEHLAREIRKSHRELIRLAGMVPEQHGL
jgi:hypothetical protein